jgi:ornithine cyclodeaminase
LVRPIRRVRVWSRTPGRALEFARVHGHGVEAVDSVGAAVAGADIICTLTGAREPILLGDQVAPGAHINAVGACIPTAAEVDTALVAKSRYVVDLRASTEAEAGEYLTALAAGAIGADHIAAELGEIVAGVKPGRQGPREITLFKSLGLAAQDLAAAHFILDRARTRGAGQTVQL